MGCQDFQLLSIQGTLVYHQLKVKQEAQVETSTETRRPFRLLGGAGKRRLLSQINRSPPKSSFRARLPNDPNTN